MIARGVKVCASVRFDVTMAQLTGRSRLTKYVLARKWCYRQLRRGGWSYPKIGRLFGRHHSTVLYALQRRPNRGPDG